jgi:hypothetical protein
MWPHNLATEDEPAFYLHPSLRAFSTLEVRCKTRRSNFITSMTTIKIYICWYITSWQQYAENDKYKAIELF